MMLPILISVSVAPGSYLFCACAPLASVAASSAASAAVVTLLKLGLCIVVLPDVFPTVAAVSISGQLCQPSDQCAAEYARTGGCDQQRCRCHFPSRGSRIGKFPSLCERMSARTIKRRCGRTRRIGVLRTKASHP